MGSRELARQMGMTHSRINRLLSTLARIGLVEQTAQRKYRPGPGLHVLAAQSMKGSRLLPAALPHLMELRSEGLTVALGVLWRRQVCYLFHRRPSQSLETAIGLHELYPAERSSIGVALLASSMPPQEASPDLREALEHVRREGFAIVRYPGGEVSIGVSVGQPPLAAIAVSGKQLDESTIPPIARRLQAIAQQIAAAVRGATSNSSAVTS
jgi:DNA-binding IclR family transcriptional regulator